MESVDPYTLQFAWDPISCGNRSGSILGYSYRLEDDKDTLEEDFLYENTTLLESSGLVPCTLHKFTLLAINENGDGPEVIEEVTTKIAGNF